MALQMVQLEEFKKQVLEQVVNLCLKIPEKSAKREKTIATFWAYFLWRQLTVFSRVVMNSNNLY